MAITRRDAGFTIFYIGINTGAFLGGLVCGYLGGSDALRRSRMALGIRRRGRGHAARPRSCTSPCATSISRASACARRRQIPDVAAPIAPRTKRCSCTESSAPWPELQSASLLGGFDRSRRLRGGDDRRVARRDDSRLARRGAEASDRDFHRRLFRRRVLGVLRAGRKLDESVRGEQHAISRSAHSTFPRRGRRTWILR